jgi:hypothetical protein
VSNESRCPDLHDDHDDPGACVLKDPDWALIIMQIRTVVEPDRA